MRPAILWLCLGLAGCAPGRAACPATFEAFLDRFVDDAAYQRRVAAAFVDVSHLENPAKGEPRTVTVRTPAADLLFPAMPSRAEQAATGRVMERQSVQGTAAEVIVVKPDTDWQTVYRFRKVGCWRLVAIDDQSL